MVTAFHLPTRKIVEITAASKSAGTADVRTLDGSRVFVHETVRHSAWPSVVTDWGIVGQNTLSKITVISS
jgi:hypothetical protein